MKPIERAARTLCALDGKLEDDDFKGKPMWQSYLPRVLAVVDALHEPSEVMKEAGSEIFKGYNPEQSNHAHLSDAANVWRYMIDSMRRDAG
ncbi:hypothetical protein [Sphingobium sp.]|uniref:hypothetical protein n=1 Tax=Sphingobium sp. TaxID=1912891 RepID=UPI003BB4C0A1